MKDNTYNIRHLRAFLAIIECKGISKATEKVYLSQPAITQAISKFEISLGSSLFERTNTGMYPTQSGSIFAARVTRALDILLNGLNRTLEYGSEKQRNVAESLLNLITTTQLKALIAIAASNSFSSAGRQVGVSQSSLHRSGRDLESLLEIQLFEKSSIGIIATNPARILAKAAKLAFLELNQACEEINALNQVEIRHLAIGSMPLARTSILPKSIIDFTHYYPDVKFSIFDGPYDDLLSHLRCGDIDILIGALRDPVPKDDVIQEKLFSSSVVIIARPDHPYMSHSEILLSELAQKEWVVPHQGAPTRAIFDHLFIDNQINPPEKLIESNSQILIRSLLQNSNKLALISKHQVQQEIDSGCLSVIPFSLNHACRAIGITTRKNWKPTASQKLFLDILKRQGKQLIKTYDNEL
ncbi:MAG: hypothetical protein CENE_03351 [Candidatus Celerinatantimonas neptuna]|nr:MAG: hypothetical protein CENE_03351 [Candidatus Celerinatantimonas neptuna]